MFDENAMSENGYITEVKRALLRQGFWGQPVKKLVEELRDHFRAKSETLEAEGHSSLEARRMVAMALGEPQAIATEWSRTLQSEGWMARHPWRMGAIGFFGIWFFYVLAVLAFIQFTEIGDLSSAFAMRPLSSFQVDGWLLLMNWMPWLTGMCFLIWKAVQSPIGWRALWVGCLVLGLATSAWEFNYYVPPQAGAIGSFSVDGET